jgi:Amt family ammonium transporter
VVGVHFVAGWIGSLSIGFFATLQVNSAIEGLGASEGLFYGGGVTQLGRQALASGIVSVYSFGVAALIALVIKKTIGLRSDAEDEVAGIDVAEHAESAYDLSPTTGSSAGGAFAMAGIGATKPAPETAEPADEPAAPVSEKVAG